MGGGAHREILMRSLVSIGAALGGLMLMTGGASALPLDRPANPSDIHAVADGCGPGMFRTPRGFCRPMRGPPSWAGRPAWDRPGWGPGWGPGPRCFIRETPWGPRRVCR